MVLLPEVGADQRLERHAHAVHHDAELNQVDHHRQGDLRGVAEAAGHKADHHVVHDAPADIDGRVHDAVPGGQQEVPEGQVPFEAQRVFLPEVVPEAGQDSQAVSDDGPQDDSLHAQEPGQDDGSDDVPADLESVADVVAQFVAVAVDHLLQVEDDDGQEGVDRNQAVVLQRQLQDLARDAAYSEIRVLHHEDQQRGEQAHADADDQALAVDLIRPVLLHGADFPGKDDADAGGSQVAEKG